jgi:uncharacterized protein DUF6496
MPEKRTLERAKRDKEEGKSPSTQAGEFVQEEIEHVRKGLHGARSTKQAIAIGLSKARRAGVKLKPPSKETASAETRRQAIRDARTRPHRPSARRSHATFRALTKEGQSAGSTEALSRQARGAAARRSKATRSQAARRAAATKAHRGIVRRTR